MEDTEWSQSYRIGGDDLSELKSAWLMVYNSKERRLYTFLDT